MKRKRTQGRDYAIQMLYSATLADNSVSETKSSFRLEYADVTEEILGFADKLFETAYKKLKKNTIFYGAGFQMKKLLITLDFCDVEFDFEIWDQNADKIQIIDGYTVKMPDWDKKAQSSQVMIVMIENNEIYEDINKRFKKLGYILFHKIEGYLSLS